MSTPHSHNTIYCKQCILDSNDYPDIKLDENGICDICHTYETIATRTVFSGEIGQKLLHEKIDAIKKQGANQEYDCILGVSGGVDSTYLALMAKKWELRPLLVHVDNGWNTELAVKNIENIVTKLDFDLYTHVIEWEEIRDVQLAFFNASVIDMDLPFDNAFVAILYRLAKKHKIRYILSGHNLVTEGWLPPNFAHHKLDSLNIKDIHQKYGQLKKLKTFPSISLFKVMFYNFLFNIESFSPLNYIDYNKDEVKQTIIRELGWKDYGGKHYENIFTRFYQGFILLNKFGVDKRKAHLSTLICSKQITREKALELSATPAYTSEQLLQEDKLFFLKKMGLSSEEFASIMAKPPVPHSHFKSYLNTISKLSAYKAILMGNKQKK